MKKIQLMNKIATVGTDVFDRKEYEVGDSLVNPDAIMVRSAALHDLEFGDNLKAIARCGAGVNNIPIERCTESGVVVFNTPGANANGVKELAVCALLLAARNVVGGIEWAKSLEGTEGVAKAVEAGKSKFAGGELAGKTLGVIGLGAIGGMVANAAYALDMQVVGCDPYLSVDAAWNITSDVKKVASFEEIYKNADYITLHVPATPATKNMICADSISMMKDGVKIINLSRADLVNAADIKAALASGKVSAYVTDFPTEDILGVPGVVAIPHLGASTAESEDNCAVMAAHELVDFLENGNIKNSVNFPNVSAPKTDAARVCVLCANAVADKVNAAVAAKTEVKNAITKAKGENAYSMIDVACADGIADELSSIEGVYAVRVIA